MVKKGFRNLQLIIMGLISVGIGPLTLIVAMLVYGLPFLDSISESATISNQTGFILPFCLGALALFSFSYAKVLAYNKLDKILPYFMFGGFTLVAAQPCASDYIEQARVGLFGLTSFLSGIAHNIGALSGFGALILWILLCFTESDVPIEQQTPEKRKRNKIYYTCGVLMAFSITLFIFNMIGAFNPVWITGRAFPIIFITEWIILTFGGVACMIKGGLFLKDKEERK